MNIMFLHAARKTIFLVLPNILENQEGFSLSKVGEPFKINVSCLDLIRINS